MRKLNYTFSMPGIISFLLIALILFAFNETDQDNYFSVQFKLLNKVSRIDSLNQFRARVVFTNINNPDILIEPTLELSNSGVSPFFVFAYDMNNNEVDIRSDADVNHLITDNLIEFKRGDTIREIIYSWPYYHFNQKGTYKLRLLFNPYYLFVQKGKALGDYIYSNWDTLTIK